MICISAVTVRAEARLDGVHGLNACVLVVDG